MKKLEENLRDYLTYKDNIKKIKPSLKLIEPEVTFKGGRIDILAYDNKTPTAIELKATQYQTRAICAQLLNYINYMKKRNGKVIFVAPKIKYGVYSTLEIYYNLKMIEFYEVKTNNNEYKFRNMKPEELEDKRKFITLEKTKIKKEIKLENILKHSKSGRLINATIDEKQKIDDKIKYYKNISTSFLDLIKTNKNKKQIKIIKQILNTYKGT